MAALHADSRAIRVEDIERMMFGASTEATRLFLFKQDLCEWRCFSIGTCARTLRGRSSHEFVAVEDLDARGSFIALMAARSGDVARTGIGAVLWHVARMRLHRRAIEGRASLLGALATVVRESADGKPRRQLARRVGDREVATAAAASIATWTEQLELGITAWSLVHDGAGAPQRSVAGTLSLAAGVVAFAPLRSSISSGSPAGPCLSVPTGPGGAVPMAGTSAPSKQLLKPKKTQRPHPSKRKKSGFACCAARAQEGDARPKPLRAVASSAPSSAPSSAVVGSKNRTSAGLGRGDENSSFLLEGRGAWQTPSSASTREGGDAALEEHRHAHSNGGRLHLLPRRLEASSANGQAVTNGWEDSDEEGTNSSGLTKAKSENCEEKIDSRPRILQAVYNFVPTRAGDLALTVGTLYYHLQLSIVFAETATKMR